MIKKYRKKPVVIEAIQWDANNWDEVQNFVGEGCEIEGRSIFINTLEGEMKAQDGDYIIKGIKGEFYPCKPDIFEQTYEEVK